MKHLSVTGKKEGFFLFLNARSVTHPNFVQRDSNQFFVPNVEVLPA